MNEQHRFGEEWKTTKLPISTEPPADRFQAIRQVGSAAGQSILESILDAYRQGHVGSAIQTLRDLTLDLGRRTSKLSDLKEPLRVHPFLLLASAYALLAHIHEEQGGEALGAASRAIELFDEYLPQLEEPSSQYINAYGVALYLTGDRKRAIEYLRKAIALGRTAPENYRYLGLALKDNEDFEEAENLLQEVLRLLPHDHLSLEGLGEIYQAQGKRDEAVYAYRKAAWTKALSSRLDECLTLLDRALTLKPDDHHTLLLKGDALRLLGRYKEALQELDRALDLDPENASALGTKGQVLYARAQYPQAAEALNHAVQLDPNAAWLHAELGETLRLLGHYEEGRYQERHYKRALEELDRALDLDPENASALGTKGQVLYARAQYPQAAEALNHAVQLDPNAAWLHAELGETLRLLGHYEEALQELDRALDLDPDHASALGSRGSVLWSLRRYEDALQALDASLALNPHDAFTLGNKGAALYGLEYYDDALRALNDALEIHPQFAWALAMKGQLLCDIACYRPALTALDAATDLGLFQDWVFALKGWALENLETNRAQEARTAYERALEAYKYALELQPNNVWLHKACGNVLFMLGDTEGATAEFRRVIKRANQPDVRWDAYALSQIGWCHYRLTEYDRAIQYFTEALSANRGMIATRFDLALVLIYDEQYSRGLSEYTTAVQLAQSKHVLRRRGLFYIALRDLELALKEKPILERIVEAQQAKDLLQKLWSDIESAGPASLEASSS